MNLLRAGDRLLEGEHQGASNREAGHQLVKHNARCTRVVERSGLHSSRGFRRAKGSSVGKGTLAPFDPRSAQTSGKLLERLPTFASTPAVVGSGIAEADVLKTTPSLSGLAQSIDPKMSRIVLPLLSNPDSRI